MSKTYQQAPGIPARDVNGMMAVMTHRSGEIHQLNEAATFLWKRCEQASTHEELLQALEDTFEAPRAQLAADLEQFLSSALEKGILVSAP